MLTGIECAGKPFPSFLMLLINKRKVLIMGYIGHSALRTYVWGERAFTDEATEDEVRKMQTIVKEAVDAGAIGFSTSGRPII